MLQTAQYISYGIGIYMVIGLVFGLYYVTIGVCREPIAGKGIILRVMLLPAAALLWPYLLKTRS